ncbi:MAG: acetyl-CoA carboxylase carboxyltransferase subunit beta [bacterium]|nr:acetyl-CoA carboxylase carboxyltransferase subunit beta [bacterium]
MNWFDKLKSGIRTIVRRGMPDNLWIKCERCHQMVYRKQMAQNQGVCPNCGAHFRIGYKEYLNGLVDPGTFQEVAQEVKSTDPLNFEDRKRYADRIKEARKTTGLDAAVCTGLAEINGQKVGVGIHEPGFIMGTLSSAEGERISRLIDRCIAERLPLILICRSGGARMMEGAFSLMQLAKINAKLALFAEEGLLFISILTDPTTAGVSASYALIGDVNIAEPNALIGFTGERITGSSVGAEELEALRAAQRAEKVLEHGFVDMVVPRYEMRKEVSRLLSLLWDPQAGTRDRQAD